MMKTAEKEPIVKIFITGFMASGKSTFAKLLAYKLNMPYKDLDELITEKAGKSINEIFKTEGEETFRKMEREGLEELIGSFEGIVALGGGALQDQDIIDRVKNSGLLISIQTPLEIITERVYDNKERPVLYQSDGEIKPKEVLFDELKTLYFRRVKYYRQAHFSLDSRDFSSIIEMTEAAINKIYSYG